MTVMCQAVLKRHITSVEYESTRELCIHLLSYDAVLTSQQLPTIWPNFNNSYAKVLKNSCRLSSFTMQQPMFSRCRCCECQLPVIATVNELVTRLLAVCAGNQATFAAPLSSKLSDACRMLQWRRICQLFRQVSTATDTGTPPCRVGTRDAVPPKHGAGGSRIRACPCPVGRQLSAVSSVPRPEQPDRCTRYVTSQTASIYLMQYTTTYAKSRRQQTKVMQTRHDMTATTSEVISAQTRAHQNCSNFVAVTTNRSDLCFNPQARFNMQLFSGNKDHCREWARSAIVRMSC